MVPLELRLELLLGLELRPHLLLGLELWPDLILGLELQPDLYPEAVPSSASPYRANGYGWARAPI